MEGKQAEGYSGALPVPPLVPVKQVRAVPDSPEEHPLKRELHVGQLIHLSAAYYLVCRSSAAVFPGPR